MVDTITCPHKKESKGVNFLNDWIAGLRFKRGESGFV